MTDSSISTDSKPREFLTGHKPLPFGIITFRQWCLGKQFFEWRSDDADYKYIIGHSNGRHDTWFLTENGIPIASNVRDDQQKQSGMLKLVKIAEKRLRNHRQQSSPGFSIEIG